LSKSAAAQHKKGSQTVISGTSLDAALQHWPLDRLVEYAGNPRVNDHAVAQCAAAIKEFGFRVPILARSDGTVIDGHLRIKSAIQLGLETVPVLLADDLSEAQVKAFRLSVNKIADLAEWDQDMLAAELDALRDLKFDMSLIGFAPGELNDLIGTPNTGFDPDEVPPAPVVPVSRGGDLWVMGTHRLLAGDSTKAEDVARLMGGAKADMVFTDPPYGVGYKGGAKLRDKLAGDEAGTTIYADALPNLRAAAADHAALYLWYADAHAAAAAAAAAAAGYVITAQIIWVKNNAQFVTSAHYKGKHEPMFYAHRRGKVARWVGENNEVTVWEVSRAPKNEYHPTQKPVELAARAIGNSSNPGDIVLDIFGGSGSTCIACETTGRRSFTLELAPEYVDVSVIRWSTLTGKQATLDGDGRTFEEVKRERTQANTDAPETA